MPPERKSSQSATEYLLIIAVVLVVVGVAVFYVRSGANFPPLGSLPVRGDEAAVGASDNDDIVIKVTSESIVSEEWQYSVSTTKGSYDWDDGTEKLEAPGVIVEENKSPGVYYVSLKHKDSGHIYFSDKPIEI